MFAKILLVSYLFISHMSCIDASWLRGFREIFCTPVGYAGSSLVPLLNEIMLESARKANIKGESLPENYKKYIDCYFDRSMLDKIVVYWGPEPFNRLNELRIDFLVGANAVGYALGYNIFIKYKQLAITRMVELITHECVHTQQFVKLNENLSNFGYHYFVQWCSGGFDYHNIHYEIEAYESIKWDLCTTGNKKKN